MFKLYSYLFLIIIFILIYLLYYFIILLVFQHLILRYLVIMYILSGRLILSLRTIIRKKVTCQYYDNDSLMSRIPERMRQLSKQSNISQAFFITSYNQWPVPVRRWFSGPHPHVY